MLMSNRGGDIAGVVVGKFDDKRRIERRGSLEVNAELTEDLSCQCDNPAISDTEGLNRCRTRIFPPVDYNPFAGVEFIDSWVVTCVFPYRFIFGKFCAGWLPYAACNFRLLLLKALSHRSLGWFAMSATPPPQPSGRPCVSGQRGVDPSVGDGH